jgi:CBS domain-containing protein
MHREPVTISPDMSTLDAIAVMGQKKVGCLPVVHEGKLVGMVTERDFIEISAKLLESTLIQAEVEEAWDRR